VDSPKKVIQPRCVASGAVLLDQPVLPGLDHFFALPQRARERTKWCDLSHKSPRESMQCVFGEVKCTDVGTNGLVHRKVIWGANCNYNQLLLLASSSQHGAHHVDMFCEASLVEIPVGISGDNNDTGCSVD
jgi:hypothetical protein